jgi:hypothetical protein
MGVYKKTQTETVKGDTVISLANTAQELGSYLDITYLKEDDGTVKDLVSPSAWNGINTYKILYSYDMISETDTTATYRFIFKPSTSSTSYIGSMFAENTKITTVDFSHFDPYYSDTSYITNLYGFFKDCTGLTTIIGFEKLNIERVSYMAYMFQGCTSLTGDIKMPPPPTEPTYKAIDYQKSTYDENWNLKDIVYYDQPKQISMNYLFANTAIKSIDFSNWTNNQCETNMAYLCEYCDGLTEVDFCAINVPTTASMFAHCTNLEKATVNKDNYITNSNHMFAYCTSLSVIDGILNFLKMTFGSVIIDNKVIDMDSNTWDLVIDKRASADTSNNWYSPFAPGYTNSTTTSTSFNKYYLIKGEDGRYYAYDSSYNSHGTSGTTLTYNADPSLALSLPSIMYNWYFTLYKTALSTAVTIAVPLSYEDGCEYAFLANVEVGTVSYDHDSTVSTMGLAFTTSSSNALIKFVTSI